MTPHIEASEIAKTVIMPGDPCRAKLIATKYLENAKLISNVRGMNAYTGTYNGVEITVMPSGMGIPSMGIYSYELFKFYGVENIIKVGTCGTYVNEFDLGDIVLVKESYSESTYALVQDNYKEHIIPSSTKLNKIIKTVENLKEVTIHTSDVFYEEDENMKNRLYEEYGCKVCEMEAYSLFHNAKKFGKHATEILTVTDNLVTGERASSEYRSEKVDKMIKIALESVIKL